jgi:TOBE domain
VSLHGHKAVHVKKSYYRLLRYLLILLVLTIFIGFWQVTVLAEEQPGGETSGSNQSPSIEPEGLLGMFKGKVVEVIHAGRHTYVHIDTGKQRLWVAVPAFDGKPGDKVLVPPCVPVADFKSKELNRVFKMMCFVGAIRRVDESTSQ